MHEFALIQGLKQSEIFLALHVCEIPLYTVTMLFCYC